MGGACRDRQAQAALKDFVAAVSHELRTPLNGILGLSDSLLAQSSCEAQPAVHKSLKMIQQCGLRLKDLVCACVRVWICVRKCASLCARASGGHMR